MPKSIAELRKQAKPTVRRWLPYELCLDADLLSQVRALVQEQSDLRQQVPTIGEGKVKRVNNPITARIRESEAKLAELKSEIDDATGTLVLSAKLSDAEWNAWVDAHPARDEGEPGFERDQRGSQGLCNVDDLVDELRKYADTWNGEPVTDEDWDFIAERANNGSKIEMALTVVSLYEQTIDLPKWRSALLGFLPSETA